MQGEINEIDDNCPDIVPLTEEEINNILDNIDDTNIDQSQLDQVQQILDSISDEIPNDNLGG